MWAGLQKVCDPAARFDRQSEFMYQDGEAARSIRRTFGIGAIYLAGHHLPVPSKPRLEIPIGNQQTRTIGHYRRERFAPSVPRYRVVSHVYASPHSHSIVRIGPNELICRCKKFLRLENSRRPPGYGERRRRPAARQSRDMDSPARSGAYAASLRDTNSVKSRTRFVLRVSPCVRSQSVPYMCRLVPGALTSRGSASPTKHGSVVIPSPCRTATICASASVRLWEWNPRGANLTLAGPVRGFHETPATIDRMGSGAPACYVASRSQGHVDAA